MNGFTGILPLSRPETIALLDGSELSLLAFGIILVGGLIGEYILDHKAPKGLKPPSKRRKRLKRFFETLVILGVAGEVMADGGIFGFGSHLEEISDSEIQQLDKENGHLTQLLQITETSEQTNEMRVAELMVTNSELALQIENASNQIAKANVQVAEANLNLEMFKNTMQRSPVDSTTAWVNFSTLGDMENPPNISRAGTVVGRLEFFQKPESFVAHPIGVSFISTNFEWDASRFPEFLGPSFVFSSEGAETFLNGEWAHIPIQGLDAASIDKLDSVKLTLYVRISGPNALKCLSKCTATILFNEAHRSFQLFPECLTNFPITFINFTNPPDTRFNISI